MRFALDALEAWTPDRSFRVERERIQAYAAATNESRPELVSGDVAPPVFAVLPVWEAIHEASRSIVPEEARSRVVHGEQDMFLHAPLRPGMDVAASAAPVGVHPKASGTTVVIKAVTRDAQGAIINEQYVTEFFRGVVAEEGRGATAPDHRVPEPVAESEPAAAVTERVDDNQTFRYAEASGDHFPIHLDEAAAQAVGLPGIIVHGLCVLAFTGRAVLSTAGAAELRRLAVRFSRPVRPGESVTTRIWQIGPDVFAFETRNEEGEAVLRDGRAEPRAP